ncbi:hypothetical protein GCM10022251_77640 [Phytohabitans flavus]|uniref:Uncharacterized protein n=1 Tax=Phytohabitans flavus TaxID=1076124 RepID=A0A6F8XIL5_9ACTN|nr:hypothetical protein Pflav_000530 [Phytohabitans flavus]
MEYALVGRSECRGYRLEIRNEDSGRERIATARHILMKREAGSVIEDLIAQGNVPQMSQLHRRELIKNLRTGAVKEILDRPVPQPLVQGSHPIVLIWILGFKRGRFVKEARTFVWVNALCLEKPRNRPRSVRQEVIDVG